MILSDPPPPTLWKTECVLLTERFVNKKLPEQMRGSDFASSITISRMLLLNQKCTKFSMESHCPLINNCPMGSLEIISFT